MSLVLNEYTGDGVTTTFNFSMAGGYLSREFVVFLTRPNDKLLEYSPYTGTVTWLSDFSVRVSDPIPIGTTFVITRRTAAAALVDFQNTSRITERNLDTAFGQSLHRTAELEDVTARRAEETANLAEDAVAAAQDAADSAATVATYAATAASLVAAANAAAGASAAFAQEAASQAEAATDTADEALALIQQAVKGNVDSFNGRGGAVLPQPGDYTPDMVGFDLDGVLTTAAAFSAVPAWSDSVLNAQAQALANRSELLRDNQKRTPLHFATLAEASAAAATLPDAQLVDVEGEGARYRVFAGALVFVEKFLRDELAESEGATLVGVKRAGDWTKKRRLAEKAEDLPHFRDWNGLTGSGGNDDTIDLQRMLTEVGNSGILEVKAHGGRFVATAPLQIRRPISIVGVGNQCPPFAALPADPGAGTYFHIAHGGIGFDISSSNGGVKFESIGTMRTQPTPGAGTFTPNDHGFDFVTDAVSDTWFKDVMLLNSSRGVQAKNGGAGRLGIWNMRGQPLIEGIRIDTMQDVCRLHDIHFWPFWAQHQKVWDWMIANADALLSFRNDNPFYTNIFSIFYRRGLVIGGNDNGTTNKMKLVNGDFDRGQTAIHILPSATGHTGTYVNVSAQGESNLGFSNPAIVADAPCELRFTNTDLRVFGANAVRVNSPGVDMSIDNLRVDEWNQRAIGFPAIEVVNGSTVSLFGRRKITSGNGAAKYGGNGLVNVDEWREFSPVIRSGVGALTSVGTHKAYAKYFGDQVQIKADLRIVDAGTADSSIIMPIPNFVPRPMMPANGTGREIITTGSSLQAIIGANSADVAIYDYKNAYPAPSNSALVVDITYPTANP